MENPVIRRIQSYQSSNEALVFFNGYQMKDDDNAQLWCHYLRKAGWQGAIYQFWWDSGSSFGKKYKMSPLGNIPIVNELAHSYPHWQLVLKRAKITGLHHFSRILSELPELSIYFIGYSLGCRVIYYGLQSSKSSLIQNQVKNVILLAGAIRVIGWENSAEKISGKIFNCYNEQDSILNNEFRHWGFYQHKPCGIIPIRSKHKKIVDLNITKLINSHSHSLENYLKNLPKLLFF
jgi:hypothetical protein